MYTTLSCGRWSASSFLLCVFLDLGHNLEATLAELRVVYGHFRQYRVSVADSSRRAEAFYWERFGQLRSGVTPTEVRSMLVPVEVPLKDGTQYHVPPRYHMYTDT